MQDGAIEVEISPDETPALRFSSLTWGDWLRFWRHVDQCGPDECWPWTASCKREGHGEFRIDKRAETKKTAAHRLAWLYANHDSSLLPADVVAHSCDNPPCCNPAHLFKTDQAGNRFDCVAKGRQAKGEENGRAVLTEAQVREIRARKLRGESNVALGREYGVNHCTIAAIANRKSWRHVASLIVGLTTLLTACTSSAEPRPDIVVVIADDLAVRDLPLAMPRVTELAAEGVQFDAAFTPLPLCGPSRISLLTGKLPRSHGFRSNDPTGFDARDTIATRLNAAGYATTIAGKLLNKHWKATHPEAGWDTYLPFDHHDDFGAAQSDVLKRQALECMSGSSPHFCYVGAVAPHGPLPGPERCQAQPIRERPPTVTEKRWSQRMSALCGLDDLVASIVQARGSDTYVIFTSDNGWMYGENGRTGKSELVLDAVQVPLIVWGPDVVPARRREIVSLVDVSATVLRLANVGRSGVEGQSFLRLLHNDASTRWVGRLEVEGQ